MPKSPVKPAVKKAIKKAAPAAKKPVAKPAAKKAIAKVAAKTVTPKDKLDSRALKQGPGPIPPQPVKGLLEKASALKDKIVDAAKKKLKSK